MPGRKDLRQLELFITGSLLGLIADDHVLVRIGQVTGESLGVMTRAPFTHRVRGESEG